MFSTAAPELFKLMLFVCSDLSSLLVHFFVTEHESEELQRVGWMFHVRVLQFNQLRICCSLVEAHWRFMKWSQCQMKRIKGSYKLPPRGVIFIPHPLVISFIQSCSGNPWVSLNTERHVSQGRSIHTPEEILCLKCDSSQVNPTEKVLF